MSYNEYNMGDFLSRHSYLVVWISALITVGAIAILILQLNAIIPETIHPPVSSAPIVHIVQTPLPPKITLTILKSKKDNTLIIQWQNLPHDTTSLKIFRGRTGTDQSTWELWKTIGVPPGELANGSTEIDLGSSSSGYSYYVEAVTGNGSGNGTSTGNENVLWTSGTTEPPVATSTPPNNPPPPPTPSSTPPNASSSGGNGSSSASGNPPGPTPTGTPYYSPEIQISSYGSSHDQSFWVEHVDQKIRIGWQNLPPQTTSVAVVRSSNQDGPWTTILTQENPDTSGASSIQVVDNTFGAPFYYEMNALVDSTVIETYGPVYLESGQ